MARSGVAYDPEVAKDMHSKLKSLSRQKPKKKKLTLRDLIEELRSDIEQAKAAGHTMDDIATVLAEGGVLIKPATLRQYLRVPDAQVETQTDVQGEVEIQDKAGIISKEIA